jgi:hypothetical protein
MKVLASAIAVPAMGLASGGEVVLVACVLGAVCIVCATFCYLLITRPEVAPRLEWRKGRIKLRFERLPTRLRDHAPGAEPDHGDQA